MAPKTGKKGGGSSSKKPAKTALEPDEGSHIVFTNAKDDSKAKKKAPAPTVPAAGGPTENAPKQPDTRTLIGGASWTGKLPLNMLSEHCQKQKWGKPDFSMSKTPEGFISSVTLKNVHPKTRETRTLPPIRLPPSHKSLAAQPTAVEARHFAAAYTLFRVASMKNIHMMMPPTYRDLWKGEWAELKKIDVKEGREWMYSADPFATAEEREMAQAKADKEREKSRAERARKEETAKAAGPGAKASMLGDKTVMKGWTNAPKVEMGKKLREGVEEMVRKNGVWNPNAVKLLDRQKESIVENLVKIGFRKSHVQEALEECKDQEECLEWLLVHVPDDDLPPWSLPEGYTAGITMASGDLKREASIKRLSESGYSTALCEKLLDKHKGNEDAVAEELQNQLLAGTVPGIDSLKVSDDAQDELESTWADEMETLKSIYDTQFNQPSGSHCMIELEVQGIKEKLILHVRKSKRYPATIPIVSIAGKLPAYIRLSIYKKVLLFAQETFLGQPMVFNIIDWLQTTIPEIVDSPGKLREVSAAAAVPTDDANSMKRDKSRQARNILPPPLTNRGSAEILEAWKKRQETPGQRRMMQSRQSLPAWALRIIIVETVNKNQVTIVSGETGSGKSTQSVQFILDDLIQRGLGGVANIICTQPRRISALGLADRVSDERCSTVGDEVGYTIRGESKQKRGVTKITFVTTGVLLRRLQTSGGSTDDVVASLADVSHVVVDEVHERSLDTDFLLILLRDVLAKRKDLKVILMSATLDAAVFEKYFVGQASVGKVEIAGRTFPVEDRYLDDVISMTGFAPRPRRGGWDDDDGAEEQTGDKSVSSVIQNLGMRINYDLIVATVQAIDEDLGMEDGGILIFLPGTAEITRTVEAINRSSSDLYALPLHASLTSQEQRRVFPPAPKGKRKVIAATNVAETSITIEDIVAVIDTGKVKETSFDPINNMVKLEEVWASRAACKQRRGRAGRVRAGVCYKLYTRNRQEEMPERPDPEIRRVPLEQLCLSVRAMGVANVPAFLASALTPPEVSAVEGALQLLSRMGALDDGNLTALGRHLSMIPADLRCAKLMVYGALFGCLESTLTIAGVLTARSPFLSPQTKREEAKAAKMSFSGNQGDLVGDLEAYTQWNELRRSGNNRDARRWCDDNFLSHQTLMDISTNRTQYLSSLKDAGFLPFSYKSTDESSLNANNTNYSLLRAVIAGSFHPQLAEIKLPDTKYAASVSGAIALDPEAKTIRYFGEGTGRLFVHPSSTLFDAQSFPGNSVYMSYFSKIATSKVFIRDLTPFNAYSLLMFGGQIALDTLGRGLVVDNWLRLKGWARIGVLVSRLRGMLDQLLADNLEDPSGAARMAESDVVALVRRLIEFDGMDR